MACSSGSTFAQPPPQLSPGWETAAWSQSGYPDGSEFFGLAETVARVGDLCIFRGDLVGDANVTLAPRLEQMTPEQRQAAAAQISATREQLVKQMLQEALQRKLMYVMFLRSIPADKLAEAEKNIAERVPEQFAEQLEEMREDLDETDPAEYRTLSRQSPQLFRLALLMRDLDLTTLRELDVHLRRLGSSLESQQQAYAEDQLGRQEMFKKIGGETEVTYDEMVRYYQEHLDDFRVPTRARWEQITVRFDRFASKFDAGEEMARLANEVYFGAPFAAVAKRSSQAPDASKGGYHDWTEWGDLKISRQINEAVFSIELGKLSRIIEDAEGLHLIRVLERQDAHVIPFAEAQLTIRKNVQADRRSEKIVDYIARLKDEVPVWTIYDRPAGPGQLAQPPRAPSGQF